MTAVSWFDLFRGRYAVYTLILNLGIGLHAIDVFVIATIMPAVVRDIGGLAFYTWSTMLYMVASIIGAACAGPVKAALATRRSYIAAALVFLVGSTGCAVAPNMALMLVARTVQGAGGGLIIALSMAMVRELYSANLRTRVLSSVSAMWGVAALLGPMVGGVFAEIDWWRGAFWAGVPIILLFTGLAWRALPTADAVGNMPRLPFRRLALLAAGVLSVGASGNVGTPAARAALVGVAVALVFLVFRLDDKATNRLFPSRPLSLSAHVGTAYWILFLVSMTHSPIGVFLPLMVQILHGVSPLVAGYFNTVFALAWSGGAILSSGLQGRRVKVAIAIGPLMITAGVAGQALVVIDGPLPALAAFAGLTGLGIGVFHVHVVNWTMSSASPGEESVTASSIPTIRALGIAFGAAFAGLVANAAGLAGGLSTESVAAAAGWIYGFCLVAPIILSALSLHLLRLHSGSKIPAESLSRSQGE